MFKMIQGVSFSTNLYDEISIDHLRQEYQKNVTELCDYYIDRSLSLNYANPLAYGDYRDFLRERLVAKHREIKKMLMSYIKTRGLRPDIDDPNAGWATVRSADIEAQEDLRINMTQQDFEIAVNAMKQEADYFRLKSVHCYCISEHPTYNKTSKVVSKIRDFTQQQFSLN